MRRRDILKMIATSPFIMQIPAQAQAIAERENLPPLLGYLRTNWSQDPFAYGSYSYLAKDSGEMDRATLAAPIEGRIYFAGEAVNPNYQSTVHAAYEAGLIAARAVSDDQHKNIAIIGAGISGLGAAHHLSRHGLNVKLFEARDRIGGRIWSDRRLGTALDLGASWIHGPIGNPIAGLAESAGIKMVETGDDSIIRGKNGRKIWSIFMPSWLNDTLMQTTMGIEWDKVNQSEVEAGFKAYGTGYEGSDVKFPDGYDQIFTALHGDYDIALSSPVTGISYSDKGVRLTLGSDQTESFDAVILTLPLGVLKQKAIDFAPVLPAEKQTAIERMGMGLLDKVYLLFETPFWDKDVSTILTPHNGLPKGQFNFWINFYKYLDMPIIAALNGAQAAHDLSQISDEDILSHALQTLKMAYPD